MTYDLVGNLRSLTDGGGKVEYTYDAVNQQRAVYEPGTTRPTKFEHDKDGLRKKTTYPNGVTIDWGYDHAHRMTSIKATNASSTVLLRVGRSGLGHVDTILSRPDGEGPRMSTRRGPLHILRASRQGRPVLLLSGLVPARGLEQLSSPAGKRRKLIGPQPVGAPAQALHVLRCRGVVAEIKPDHRGDEQRSTVCLVRRDGIAEGLPRQRVDVRRQRVVVPMLEQELLNSRKPNLRHIAEVRNGLLDRRRTLLKPALLPQRIDHITKVPPPALIVTCHRLSLPSTGQTHRLAFRPGGEMRLARLQGCAVDREARRRR